MTSTKLRLAVRDRAGDKTAIFASSFVPCLYDPPTELGGSRREVTYVFASPAINT